MVRIVESSTYVDPFTGGTDLDDADCAARLRELYGEQFAFEHSMLAAHSNREILARVLRNLVEIYRSRGDARRALAAIDRIVLLLPESPRLRRERAALLTQMGEYHRALFDLRDLRKLQPSRRRGERFRAWRRFVEEMAARMN
jgi:regulator of sirC expression with transglutaminase-like and TPR domain